VLFAIDLPKMVSSKFIVSSAEQLVLWSVSLFPSSSCFMLLILGYCSLFSNALKFTETTTALAATLRFDMLVLTISEPNLDILKARSPPELSEVNHS